MQNIDKLRPAEDKNERMQTFVENLAHLRNDFSDEIPDRIIEGEGNYKVRSNWFQGFFLLMETVADQGLFTDPTLPNDVEDFYAAFKNRRAEWMQQVPTREPAASPRDAIRTSLPEEHYRTTQEEIETANTLLDRAIENLKEQIRSKSE